MKVKTLTCCIAFLLVLSVAITTYADTVRLKNGTVIKGKVINFTNGAFTVVLSLGAANSSRAIIDVQDVEAIEFDSSDNGETGVISPPVTPKTSYPDDDKGHQANTKIDKPNIEVNNNRGNVKESAVAVQAKEDWTYTNLSVKRGDRVQINATGKVKISNTRDSGPEGVDLEDRNKLILDRPTGGLIAVVGDDNDDFIYIGREAEFVATRDGKLFLSVNEGDLTDNSGSFTARVKIEPSR
jgi:hypothetical protein